MPLSLLFLHNRQLIRTLVTEKRLSLLGKDDFAAGEAVLIFDKGGRKYQSKIFTVKNDDIPEVSTRELAAKVTWLYSCVLCFNKYCTGIVLDSYLA